MRFTTLIDTDQLAVALADPGLILVDCRFDLKDTGAGEGAYSAAHIPGAVYAHLDRDLSGEKTGLNGRHPLPPPGVFAETLGRLGVGAGVQVVAYDQDSGMFASRLWWMLRWLGHDTVAVLNGGFLKWTAEGRPTRSGVETHSPQTFVPHVRHEMVATTADVALLAQRKDWQLIDARSPERYRGDIEPLDRVPGHIPNALNHHFRVSLDDHERFLPGADLAAQFRESLKGIAPDHAVCYCGSGVTACHNLLAMEHAGLRGAKLYPGSWSEWAADPSRAVERTD